MLWINTAFLSLSDVTFFPPLTNLFLLCSPYSSPLVCAYFSLQKHMLPFLRGGRGKMKNTWFPLSFHQYNKNKDPSICSIFFFNFHDILSVNLWDTCKPAAAAKQNWLVPGHFHSKTTTLSLADLFKDKYDLVEWDEKSNNHDKKERKWNFFHTVWSLWFSSYESNY